MSPQARDALISNIAQCIAQEAFATFTPQLTQTQMAIVTPFQSTQTTQVRTTMTMTMTATMTMTTTMTMTQSDIIVLGGGHCIAGTSRLREGGGRHLIMIHTWVNYSHNLKKRSRCIDLNVLASIDLFTSVYSRIYSIYTCDPGGP